MTKNLVAQEVEAEKDNDAFQLQLENMEFNLCDFALFLSVMKNWTAHQTILSIITGEADLQLKEVHVEEVILNKGGHRAIRLDARSTDVSGRNFATEMQNDTTQDDMRRRARYYQGLIDTPVLKSGRETRYKNLPPTIITFITQKDIFGKGLAKYTFTEQCEEIKGLHLEDGTTKIFVNMSSKNGEPVLVSLLQYMKHTTLQNPEIVVKDERITELDKIVTEVKQSEEWEAVKMSILSVGIERGKEIGLQQGRAEGISQGKALGITQGKALGIAQGKVLGVAQGKAESVLNLLEETGPISKSTQKLILSETDTNRLQVWLRKAARADSEEDFLKSI